MYMYIYIYIYITYFYILPQGAQPLRRALPPGRDEVPRVRRRRPHRGVAYDMCYVRFMYNTYLYTCTYVYAYICMYINNDDHNIINHDSSSIDNDNTKHMAILVSIIMLVVIVTVIILVVVTIVITVVVVVVVVVYTYIYTGNYNSNRIDHMALGPPGRPLRVPRRRRQGSGSTANFQTKNL